MSLKPLFRHPTLSASKNVQIPTVSEFNEIRRDSYISRDDSNGKVRFVIQDLEKFQIFTKIMILLFFRKLEFSQVLQRVTKNLTPTRLYIIYNGLILINITHLLNGLCGLRVTKNLTPTRLYFTQTRKNHVELVSSGNVKFNQPYS